MKKLFVILSLLLSSAGIAHAETKPFNLALVDPVQIVDSSHDISGVRLNLLYGKNTNFKGLDLGIGLGKSNGTFDGVGLHYAANLAVGNAKGAQFAYGINLNLADFTGGQFGGCNYTQGNFEGAALGIVNLVKQDAKGFKLSIFNYARGNFSGLQLGLVNIGGLKNGLQIGLVNINKNKKPLPFFPFVNFSF